MRPAGTAVTVRASSLPGWWLVEEAAVATLVGFVTERAQLAAAELAAQRSLVEHGLGLRHRPSPELSTVDLAGLGDGGEGGDALWFAAPAGWPADAPENQVQGTTLLEGLGAALARLHAMAPPAHLVAVDNAELVARAAARVLDDVVERTRFDRSRQGLEPRRLLQQVEQWHPLLANRRPVSPVVTHGALRLGAVFLDRGSPTALLGAAGLAIGDPYRDLAAMARSLAAVFGPEALPGFFRAYGLPDPDPIRLEFHALLDELL